ncbi:MAG: hypothetical protein MZV70_46615 [Desulfobacterales bacterium]|nr:hypothetical protein [Desulfobacterales bacterium]
MRGRAVNASSSMEVLLAIRRCRLSRKLNRPACRLASSLAGKLGAEK